MGISSAIFCLIILLIILVGLLGCRATFNHSGKFAISLNQASNTNTNNAIKDKDIITDIITQFESVDEDSGATGNLTDKSAANCAGGVCTIY